MAILRWKKVTAGVYHATSPWGLYVMDGFQSARSWMVIAIAGSE